MKPEAVEIASQSVLKTLDTVTAGMVEGEIRGVLEKVEEVLVERFLRMDKLELDGDSLAKFIYAPREVGDLMAGPEHDPEHLLN